MVPGIAGAEPSPRSLVGDAFRRLPLGSGAFREVRVASVSHFEEAPFKGIRIRAIDPRAQKRRPPIRVFSFEEMHRFAKAAGRYEALVRTFTDTGMRLGEVLPLSRGLRRRDSRRTAHEGHDPRGHQDRPRRGGRRSRGPRPGHLAWMFEAQINLNGPECELIFTTPSGRMWRERNFYRDVWKPTQEASGLDIRPHECRHSYVTHLRAAGVDDADLARIIGHSVYDAVEICAFPWRRLGTGALNHRLGVSRVARGRSRRSSTRQLRLSAFPTHDVITPGEPLNRIVAV